MDDLKRPGSILSLFNTVYIIGTTIFFYKKIKEMNVKIDDFSNLVNTTINATTQLKNIEQILDRYRQVITELDQRNAKLENNMKKIQKLLKKHGINNSKKYSSSEEESSEETEEESSEEDEVKKKRRKKKKKKISINDLGI